MYKSAIRCRVAVKVFLIAGFFHYVLPFFPSASLCVKSLTRAATCRVPNVCSKRKNVIIVGFTPCMETEHDIIAICLFRLAICSSSLPYEGST